MDLNQFTLRGHIAKEPDFGTSKDGTLDILRFTVQTKIPGGDKTYVKNPPVVAFGRLVERMNKLKLGMGDYVQVDGELDGREQGEYNNATIKAWRITIINQDAKQPQPDDEDLPF